MFVEGGVRRWLTLWGRDCGIGETPHFRNDDEYAGERWVILTLCRCVCVVRWYEGSLSEAPPEGSSSRKTDLDFKKGTNYKIMQ